MKVEVIKGVEHSIELNFGESSVCITPDEAQKLIGQLRAVVPVPSDVEEAAEMAARRKYPYEGGTKGAICEAKIPIYREGFIAGAEWQSERLMKDAVEVVVHYDFENRLAVTANLPEDSPYKFCDKVSVIIIKKEK